MDISIYLKLFFSLFALVNPVGNIPVLNALVRGLNKKNRTQIVFKAAVAICVALLASLFLGKPLLQFFSLSMDSFRIAGGILIIIIALSMVQGNIYKHSKSDNKDLLDEIKNFAIVPIAIPIMAGPGSFSTVIVESIRHSSIVDHIGFSIAIILFSVVCYYMFKYSHIITDKLGKTGSSIITRVMGILLMAIGVEMIAGGVFSLIKTHLGI